MLPSKLTKVCSAAAIAVGLGAVLQAHDIAVFPVLTGGNLAATVRYGHPGDYSAAAAGRLVTLDSISPTGATRPLAGRLRPEGINLTMTPLEIDASEAGTWILAAFYDNQFSLRTAEGRVVNTTLAEYPKAQSVTHNLKYGKSLLRVGGSSRGFDRVVGHQLEIVPRSDPFAVKAGGTLEVEIRFGGKPLPNGTVRVYANETTADATERTTDASGIAQMPIARGGRHILSIEHGAPSRHPEFAMRDAYAASLVFSLPE